MDAKSLKSNFEIFIRGKWCRWIILKKSLNFHLAIFVMIFNIIELIRYMELDAYKYEHVFKFPYALL